MFEYKNQNESKRRFVILAVTFIEFLSSILIFYFISVFFGAYLVEDFKATLIFSIQMSLLSLMPIFLLIEHKNPLVLLERILVSQELHCKFESYLLNMSYGAFVGAWSGALVIPLDWDRWWQQWPISCCLGSLAGSLIGIGINKFKISNKTKRHL